TDLTIDIGTAGSTSLVLQTLHLPLAMRAETAVRVVLTGGTFNPKAPAYPFLEHTWRAYLAALGLPIALAMPAAGFYPRGGGRLEAWIEPAMPKAWVQTGRGSLRRILGIAGVANLRNDIAGRLRDRALRRLREHGLTADVEIETVRWPSPASPPRMSRTRRSTSCSPSRLWTKGPSTPTRPIKFFSPWRSPRAAPYTPSARPQTTSAPTPPPSAPSSTAQS